MLCGVVRSNAWVAWCDGRINRVGNNDSQVSLRSTELRARD
jgi:hypothetical protein